VSTAPASSKDLAQFLESQPHMFAVFTNDEVARVAAMARATKPTPQPERNQ
jgi:hypothetical protein